MRQTYSAEDDVRHIRALMPALEDPRYIRVQGRPLLLVYRVNDLPDARATADRWRNECVRAGVGEPYLCSVMSLPELHFDATTIGFDAGVEFQPRKPLVWHQTLPCWRRLHHRLSGSDAHRRHRIRAYPQLANRSLLVPPPDYKVFLGVTPGWDNTPRRPSGGGFVLSGSTPRLYEQWLRAVVCATLERHTGDEQLTFINAWNEWAEGNHLEPDQRWGRRYLTQTRAALWAVGLQRTSSRAEH
jgi:hypothetical protein